MSIEPDLHQKLIELHYDLLPEAEADQLRGRLQSEPSLAEAYAAVRRQVVLLGEAARLEAPRLRLERPAASAAATSSSSTPVTRSNLRRSPATGRVAGWVVGLAAAALLLLSVGGYWRHRSHVAALAGEHVRLVVSGPATLEAGVMNRYSVRTMSALGDPLTSVVDYTLYSPEGDALFSAQMPTDDEGQLALEIPAEVDVSRGGKLEVEAAHGDVRQRIEPLLLAAEPVRYVTRLSLDKPLYRPGETVFYRSLTLNRLGLAAESEMLVHFEIRDPSGAVLSGSEQQGATDKGVGNGAFAIPADLAGGQYTLAARSLNEAFPEETREFFIRQYRTPRLKKELEFVRDSYAPGDTVVADFSAETAQGDAAAGATLQWVATVDGAEVWRTDAAATPSGTYRAEFNLPTNIERGDGQLIVVVDDGGARETIAKTIPINLGKVDVQLYPEGGDLVAGVDNWVYFSGRDPLGEPVHLEGHVVDSRGKQIVEFKTTYEGMGRFSLTPQRDESYRLNITKPGDVTSQPELPQVAENRALAMTLPAGVVEADEPLAVQLRTTRSDRPLVVVVACRGVPVAHQVVVVQQGDNVVEMPLADDVGGVLRVTVYDYATQPPQPVVERLAFRRMQRQLNVEVTGASPRYSPGEPVRLSLQVTDEQGQPTAATLGVAVVDDVLLNLADDKSPGLRTHFLLTTDLEKPADLEDADFYLSDDPAAAAALDLLLGTQGWRRFVERTLEELKQQDAEEDEQIARLMALDGAARPPTVSDNLPQVREEFEASAAEYSADRVAMIGGLSIIGSVALLLLLLMTVLLRLVRSVELGLPALAAAAASLVFGAWLLSFEGPASLTGGPVAYNPFRLVPVTVGGENHAGDRWYDGYLAFGDRQVMLGKGLDNKLPVDAFVNEFFAKGFDDDAPEAMLEDRAVAGEDLAIRVKVEERDRIAGFRFDARDKQLRDLLGPLQQGFEQNKREVAFLDEAMFDGALADEFNRKRIVMQAEAGSQLGGLGFGGFASDDVADYRFTVRQYAHVHVPAVDGVRADFAETLYWHPLLTADDEGRATIEFQLSDSITSFHVSADAHGGGRIGSGGGEIVSRLPFNLSPKLPLAVTAGDRIEIPLGVANDTPAELPVRLTFQHDALLNFEGPAEQELQLAAGGRGRHFYWLDVVGDSGLSELEFRGEVATGEGNRLTDAVRRSVKVVPPGFPIHLSYGGRLEGEQEVVVRLPDDWVPGSLEVTLNAFPSTLADLQNGLDGILREPTGCFEQASTSNYPNVLALKYMQEHDVADPQVTRRAKSLLSSGYGRLTGYECPEQGYEWFGGDPGHEALSAYGLMQFRDMTAVYDVDQEMIRRTADWLLDRRDGKGGFLRNARALDSFGGAPDDVTNAYITWALSESGQEGIDAEIEHIKNLGRQTDDPYVIALAAASLLNTGDQESGRELLKKLADSQDADGHLTGTQGSITRSGGLSLDVETTALAAMAWLKEPSFREPAERAIRWITASRQGGGGFGSTQATILALKALVTHARASRGTVTGGELVIRRDNVTIGSQPFAAGANSAIAIDGIAARLEPGENRLAIVLTGDNQMPYGLDVSYRSRTPASDEACPLRLTTNLAAEQVKAGETVKLTARLTNTTDAGQPMSIAILGLPAGLEPRADQLEELKKAGTFDYYETREREIICYWRSLAPEAALDMSFDLVAEIPGRYTAPASRAYLYYTAEQKQWVEPLVIQIARP